MAYHSPLHILAELGEPLEKPDRDSIKRIRKKLLAEFTLSGENTIKIGKKSFTKDDVLKQLDALLEISDFEMHFQIYHQKGMLSLLENPQKWHRDPNEIVTALNEGNLGTSAREYIIQSNLLALKSRLKKRNFLLALNHYEIYEKCGIPIDWNLQETIGEFLQTTGELLQSVHAANFHQPNIRKSVEWLTERDWVDFLNHISDEFYSLVRDFVVDVINFCVGIQHSQKKFCLDVSYQTLSLEVDEDLKNLLQNNYNIYKKNYSGVESSFGGKSFYWIFLGIWLVIILFRLSNCENRRSSHNFESYMTNRDEFERVQRKVYHYLDSLKRKHHDSALLKDSAKVQQILKQLK